MRNRHAEFRAALYLAGQSVSGFARAANIHATHLHFIVTGRRSSKRVEALLDALIETHLPRGIPAVPMPQETPCDALGRAG